MSNNKSETKQRGGRTPRTQRVQNLIDHFMDYYGRKTIQEIAEIFQVDFSTVYKNLEIIAKSNGKTREELLVYPEMGGPKTGKSANPFRKDIINAQKLNDDFETAYNSLDEIITELIKIQEEVKC